VSEKTPYERVKDWLDNVEMRAIIQRTLPQGTPADPWVEMALTTVRTSRDVSEAEPLSIMGTLMTLASLGLRLEGPLGQAFLSTRNVKDRASGQWTKECQAQIGYRGLMAIARRDPDVRDIDATIVYGADEFDFQKGTEMWLRHRWDVNLANDERGEMCAVYAALRYRDNYYTFDVYPMADVMELREKILRQNHVTIEYDDQNQPHYWKHPRNKKPFELDPGAAGVLPWIGWPIPMIQKTAVRWASKYWNMNPDFERAANLVALADAGVSQELAQAALDVMPTSMRHQAEQETGIAADPGRQATAASFRTSKSLKDRLVAEATKGQQVDDRPEGQLPLGEASAEGGGDDLTDEEKQAILDAEKAEAEAEERARRGE